MTKGVAVLLAVLCTLLAGTLPSAAIEAACRTQFVSSLEQQICHPRLVSPLLIRVAGCTSGERACCCGLTWNQAKCACE